MVVAPLHGLDLRNPPIFDRTLSQGSLARGYTLFDAARRGRLDYARALADAARSSGASARMQLLADVTSAFVRVRTSQEVADAHASRLEALQRERTRAS